MIQSASVCPERVNIKGVMVYPFASVDALIDYADSKKGILVAVNAEKILNATEQTRDIINSNIAYCDGSGAVLAARQKGARQASKIAGCELWLKIIDRYSTQKSFYIIGASSEVNAATVEKLRRDYPGINIIGHRDGYLRSPEEREALIADVVAKKPDVVFVAMGSPRQEILMSEMLARHRAIYQGLGGSFDVYAGSVRRAPKWWIDHNVEFAYRLIRQPRRISRNITFIKFAWWLFTRQF